MPAQVLTTAHGAQATSGAPLKAATRRAAGALPASRPSPRSAMRADSALASSSSSASSNEGVPVPPLDIPGLSASSREAATMRSFRLAMKASSAAALLSSARPPANGHRRIIHSAYHTKSAAQQPRAHRWAAFARLAPKVGAHQPAPRGAAWGAASRCGCCAAPSSQTPGRRRTCARLRRTRPARAAPRRRACMACAPWRLGRQGCAVPPASRTACFEPS